MKTKTLYLLAVLLLAAGTAYAQTSDIKFVNTGKMHIGHRNAALAAGDTALYVPQSMVSVKAAEILQTGRFALGGNWYQNADTAQSAAPNHNFAVGADKWGVSTGEIVFTGNTAGAKRYIARTNATRAAQMTDFDRADFFVAFPNIKIATSDSIIIPANMGIDALTVKRPAGATGKIVLRSEIINKGDGDEVFDASLRISKTGIAGGQSGAAVDAGSVIVERDISLYRGDGSVSTSHTAYPLFAFAPPMTNLRAAYFAGHWVRKLIPNATTGHVNYPFGNQTDDNGTIIRNQYLYQPENEFVAGNGYLVKVKPEGYNWDEMTDNNEYLLAGGSTSIYEKGKFVFNGQPYTMTYRNEQLFAADTLFSQKITANHSSDYINWIIGNSWTSAVNVDSLVDYLANSSINFDPNIYLFPGGSTTYQPVLRATQMPNVPQLAPGGVHNIPSQSLVLLRLAKDASTGDFNVLKRKMQTHYAAPHNRLRAPQHFDSEIAIKATPADNTRIYDLAVVGLRQNAQGILDPMDAVKISHGDAAFLLYTLSDDNRRLSINSTPLTTERVPLGFYTGANEGEMTFSFSRTESLEYIMLEDLLTRTMTDLKQTDTYTFTVNPLDTPERFLLHFRAPTGVETPADNFLQCYYHSGELTLKGLMDSDLNATVTVYDMAGRALRIFSVDNAPEMTVHVPLLNGVYAARMTGKRTVMTKFVK